MTDRYHTMYSSSLSEESGFCSDMSDDANDKPSAADGVCEPTTNTSCVGMGTCDQRAQVKAMTSHLVTIVIENMAKPATQPTYPCCHHAATLLRVVADLSSRHEIVFESIMRRLQSGLNGHHQDIELYQRTLCGVVDELFADGNYNWGRIVTVFAFAGWLARSSHAEKSSQCSISSWTKNVSFVAGNYISGKLCEWVYQQGGWDAMDKFFDEPEPLESKMWRGLMYTAVGLGVLATVAAVVR